MLDMCKETYIQVLRTSITEATAMLKREPKYIYTNNFNIGISTLWDANMDIRIVFNAFAAASYCTSYMTKNDTATSRAMQSYLRTKQGKQLSHNWETTKPWQCSYQHVRVVIISCLYCSYLFHCIVALDNFNLSTQTLQVSKLCNKKKNPN